MPNLFNPIFTQGLLHANDLFNLGSSASREHALNLLQGMMLNPNFDDKQKHAIRNTIEIFNETINTNELDTPRTP